MKPKHIKEQRQKEVRRIWNRRYEIWNEMRALGYIKLDKPIRHGWFKEIVITHKVERYKNEAAILELYDKIEKCFWGRTKPDAESAWQKQTSSYLIYRDFPTISKKQFNKLSFKAQCLCTPFYYRNAQKKLRLRFYIRIPKAAYRIKYTRAYITHSKRIDPQLESESALLDQQLLKSGYYEANERQHNWKDDWNLSERKKEKLIIERALKRLKSYPIKDILEEQILWEIN
ncbi:hypothetical protein [Seonamhaeicola marinus]|uniref:Uncharacterized protein n=1 Tax=Seonamhaeicola marinus TaxID=1912246 RepID=A0A5D0I6T3_9FLAO|nr:hypothetical protein [Seonamhaeicola marinus]TYA78601.1 hypothetical protein FUA24_09620 [Seonamhaeicola marinus]